MKRLKMSISQSTRKCTSIILSLVMVISLFSFSMITTNATSDTASKTVKVNDATKATDVDGLVTNKTATANADGTFTLNLEAYATGKVTTGKVVPTDFILVLDQSGSMSTDKINTSSEINQDWTEKNFNDNSKNNSTLYYLKDGKEYEVYIETEGYRNNKKQYLAYTTKGYQTNQIGNKVSASDENAIMYSGVLKKVTPISKQTALKNAVESFMNSVQQDAAKNNVDHRMAMVGFASTKDVSSDKKYKNTALLSTSNVIDYPNININQYKNSLVSVNTNGTINTRLITAKDRIQASGATDPSAGMDMAQNVLKATNDDVGRNKVVIMFTDGHPGQNSSSWKQSAADKTIEYSKVCKETYGATVYTIGVFTEDDKKSELVNNFMDFVSSNYPNATGMGKNGKDEKGSGTPGKKESDKYYKLADDENALLGVFGDIAADSAAPSINLDSKAILQDVLSDEFVLAEEVSESIRVYTAPHIGNFEFGTKTEFKEADIAVDGKKIQVTNFDYAANFCVTKTGEIETSGKKLIVEIKVKRNQTTYGGNGIPTNTIASAIYDGKTKDAVETFPIPTVNLDIRYDITTKNKSIYLGESVNVNELIELPTHNINYVPDGNNNRNVDITYELIDKDRNIIATKEIKAGMSLKGDLFTEELYSLDNKVLNWMILVTSVNEQSNVNEPTGAMVIGKESNVYVFTPVIQASDQTIFYGETAEPLASGLSVEDWVCKGNMDAPKPTSEKPNVSYELKQVNGESIPNNLALEDTLNVKIDKVKLNDKAVDSQYVEIKNDNCKLDDHAEGRDFTIHVVKGQIEINKKIDAQYSNESKINSYQTFVYKIERSETEGGPVVETFYQTLSFAPNDNKTEATAIISNLKKGYYTVTEEEKWSKKYTLTSTTDNYEFKDGGEGAGKDLPIGLRDDHTGYYGLDQECYEAKGFKGKKAQITFKNDLKSWAGWYSDAAGSKNTFNK